MSDRPWLRPLPALLLMSFVGFWGSFAIRESDEALMVTVLIAVLVASPVYWIAYALTLVTRGRKGKPSPKATAFAWRLAHQAIILAVIALAGMLSWMLLTAFTLVFGAPPEIFTEGVATSAQFGLRYLAITMAIVLPLEVLYSLLAAGTTEQTTPISQ